MHRIVNTPSLSSTAAAEAAAPAAPATARPQHVPRTLRPDTPRPQQNFSLRGLRRAGRPQNPSGSHDWPLEQPALPPWLTTLDLSRKPSQPQELPEPPPSLRRESVDPNHMAGWVALVTPKIDRLTTIIDTAAHGTTLHTQQQTNQSGGKAARPPHATQAEPGLPGAFKHFTTETTDAAKKNVPIGTGLARLRKSQKLPLP